MKTDDFGRFYVDRLQFVLYNDMIRKIIKLSPEPCQQKFAISPIIKIVALSALAIIAVFAFIIIVVDQGFSNNVTVNETSSNLNYNVIFRRWKRDLFPELKNNSDAIVTKLEKLPHCKEECDKVKTSISKLENGTVKLYEEFSKLRQEIYSLFQNCINKVEKLDSKEYAFDILDSEEIQMPSWKEASDNLFSSYDNEFSSSNVQPVYVNPQNSDHIPPTGPGVSVGDNRDAPIFTSPGEAVKTGHQLTVSLPERMQKICYPINQGYGFRQPENQVMLCYLQNMRQNWFQPANFQQNNKFLYGGAKDSQNSWSSDSMNAPVIHVPTAISSQNPYFFPTVGGAPIIMPASAPSSPYYPQNQYPSPQVYPVYNPQTGAVFFPNIPSSTQVVNQPYRFQNFPFSYPAINNNVPPIVALPQQLGRNMYCTYVPISNVPTKIYKFPTVDGVSEVIQRSDGKHAEIHDFSFKVKKTDYHRNKTIIHEKLMREDICEAGEIVCRDGLTCVPYEAWCDGTVNCPDLSDESFCPCKFRINKDKYCDGYFDCPDGEDEQECFACPKNTFSCDDWSGIEPAVSCVHISKRCDGTRHCPNGKDEQDCSIITDFVGHHSTIIMSYGKGYLHKNWKGKWRPVCAHETFQIWAQQGCDAEFGKFNSKAELLVKPLPGNYNGPFIGIDPAGDVVLVDKCPNDYTTWVDCKQIRCGIRMQQKNSDGELYDRYKRFTQAISQSNNNLGSLYSLNGDNYFQVCQLNGDVRDSEDNHVIVYYDKNRKSVELYPPDPTNTYFTQNQYAGRNADGTARTDLLPALDPNIENPEFYKRIWGSRLLQPYLGLNPSQNDLSLQDAFMVENNEMPISQGTAKFNSYDDSVYLSNYRTKREDKVNVKRKREYDTNGRVVGGKKSKPGEWPWLIALFRDGRFHCGGVILTPNVALTAAHCVHKFQSFYYEVSAGMLRRYSFSPQEQIRKVIKIVVHEGYNQIDFRNDIALLEVDKHFVYNRWVLPICLPGTISVPRPGTKCTAVGWGATYENGLDPDHLHFVEIPIQKSCKYRSDRAGGDICAGYLEGGKDTCQGDSGGPLLCKVDNTDHWYLAGIVSHGKGCARFNEPGVYTRVALYLEWIQFNLENLRVVGLSPLNLCPGFQCKNYRCISKNKRCNGKLNCLNGDDELTCKTSLYERERSEMNFNESSEIVDFGFNPMKNQDEGGVHVTAITESTMSSSYKPVGGNSHKNNNSHEDIYLSSEVQNETSTLIKVDKQIGNSLDVVSESRMNGDQEVENLKLSTPTDTLFNNNSFENTTDLFFTEKYNISKDTYDSLISSDNDSEFAANSIKSKTSELMGSSTEFAGNVTSEVTEKTFEATDFFDEITTSDTFKNNLLSTESSLYSQNTLEEQEKKVTWKSYSQSNVTSNDSKSIIDNFTESEIYTESSLTSHEENSSRNGLQGTDEVTVSYNLSETVKDGDNSVDNVSLSEPFNESKKSKITGGSSSADKLDKITTLESYNYSDEKIIKGPTVESTNDNFAASDDLDKVTMSYNWSEADKFISENNSLPEPFTESNKQDSATSPDIPDETTTLESDNHSDEIKSMSLLPLDTTDYFTTSEQLDKVTVSNHLSEVDKSTSENTVNNSSLSVSLTESNIQSSATSPDVPDETTTLESDNFSDEIKSMSHSLDTTDYFTASEQFNKVTESYNLSGADKFISENNSSVNNSSLSESFTESNKQGSATSPDVLDETSDEIKSISLPVDIIDYIINSAVRNESHVSVSLNNTFDENKYTTEMYSTILKQISDSSDIFNSSSQFEEDIKPTASVTLIDGFSDDYNENKFANSSNNTLEESSQTTEVSKIENFESSTTILETTSISPFSKYTLSHLESIDRSSLFSCTETNQIILSSRICDGLMDCIDGSDERNCTCRNKLKNIAPNKICDSVTDCKDGSDEFNCAEHCGKDQFYCAKSNKCIDINSRCDRKDDCKFNEDETDCFALTNDEYLQFDDGGRPQLLREGIAVHFKKQWRSYCLTDNSRMESDAMHICKELGFSEATKYDKRQVSNSTFSRLSNSSDMLVKNSSDTYCEGLYISCSYTMGKNKPWLANIYVEGKLRSVGILLTDSWIVVSSAALINIFPDKVYVSVSIGNMNSPKIIGPYEQNIPVDKISSVPDSLITLLHINKPVNLNHYTMPIGINYWSPPSDEVCEAIALNNNGEITFVSLKTEKTNCEADKTCYHINMPSYCSDYNDDNELSGQVVCYSNYGAYISSMFRQKDAFCCLERFVKFNAFSIKLEEIKAFINSTKFGTYPSCDTHRCPHGNCLDWQYLDDGIHQCPDGSDETELMKMKKEKYCLQHNDCNCGPNMFRCSSGECISLNNYCNGKSECADSSDEIENCRDNCPYFLNATLPDYLCDGSSNCYQKDDEAWDLCGEKIDCTDSEHFFQCHDSDICIPNEFICDGDPDCPDEEDEYFCVGLDINTSGTESKRMLMSRKYGYWYPQCFTSDIIEQSSMLNEICEKLGYDSVKNASLEKVDQTIFIRDPFSGVTLNSDIHFTIRSKRPFAETFKNGTCNALYIECNTKR
ncbi:hypothetical protein O3M35_009614 [Rhynocoris fuscipes]|uniref:Serine protease nudel n=1 Tax=Rhynocoris fuscipes TaxID=488301 RepID=A0AAW1D9H8_9HEMI